MVLLVIAHPSFFSKVSNLYLTSFLLVRFTRWLSVLLFIFEEPAFCLIYFLYSEPVFNFIVFCSRFFFLLCFLWNQFTLFFFLFPKQKLCLLTLDLSYFPVYGSHAMDLLLSIAFNVLHKFS